MLLPSSIWHACSRGFMLIFFLYDQRDENRKCFVELRDYTNPAIVLYRCFYETQRERIFGLCRAQWLCHDLNWKIKEFSDVDPVDPTRNFDPSLNPAGRSSNWVHQQGTNRIKHGY